MAHQTSPGVIFVQNYLRKEWPTDRKQDRWAILPRESDMLSVHVLFQFAPTDVSVDGSTGIPKHFNGMQLVFEILFHEEHPHKPPSLKAWTPNGRAIPGERLCIDGLTAWHPESWNIITTVSSIVERFIAAFVDIESVTDGVGFVKNADMSPDDIAMFAGMSPEWNRENFPALVDIWQQQCKDNKSTIVPELKTENNGCSGSDDHTTETSDEYYYSDGECEDDCEGCD